MIKSKLWRRILAFVIDWNVIMLISLAPMWIFTPWEHILRPSIRYMGLFLPLSFFLILIIIPIKDLMFRNASLGKKLLKIQVVNIHTGNVPTVGQMIVRNITQYVFIIELLVMLFNKQIRLGDIMANTVVVPANKK